MASSKPPSGGVPPISVPRPPPVPRPAASVRPPEPPASPVRAPAETLHAAEGPSETVSLPRLSIVVEREAGGPIERIVVHDGDMCRVGSHPSNDVVLKDPTVSRFHCRLVREAGTWRVRDSGSSNGTRLDGVRVRDADLGPDSRLALGTSTIRIRSGVSEKQDTVPVLPAFGALVGASLPMRRLFALLEKVAGSEIHVLIEGESGTGKELVATEIVQRSPRADKPFIVVDCGAIAPSLVESELFGHVRGAFTGAERDRVGAFEAADGGTVFLDEVGELPIELQPKLLRALEAREIRRVGEARPRKVDVRVISATNRDLEREVNRGRFREDLYFRLAVITARVPSLRERLDDLLLLVRTFLANMGVPQEERLFPPPVLAEMCKYDWPGNVRELRNYVERSVVLESASASLGGGAGGPGAPAGTPGTLDFSVPFRIAKEGVIDSFERAYITQLLETAGGNMSKAARIAGMDRMYLHRLVQKHGLRKSESGRPPPGGAKLGE